MSSSPAANLLETLRQRGVIRSVTFYIGISWVVIGACDIVFPMFGISGEVLRIIVLSVAAGLPVIVSAAWFLRHDDETGSQKKRTGIDLVILAVLGIALSFSAVYAYVGDAPATTPDIGDNKISIFLESVEDLSAEVKPGFAKALDYEIRSRLNPIPNWETRNASDTQMNGYLLKPSVRVEGEIVRLNITLEDQPSGRLIQGFSTDVSMLDESRLQRRIAAMVGFIAYDAIRFEIEKAQSYERTGSYAAAEIMEAARRNNRKAIYDLPTCARAISLDPNFEPANVCMLSLAMLAPLEFAQDTGLRLLARLRETNPDSPDADIAEAIHALIWQRNYDKAERLFQQAERKAPYSDRALQGLAWLYFVTGRLDDSLETYKQVIPLFRANDPLFSRLTTYQYYIVAYTAQDYEGLIAETKIDNPFYPPMEVLRGLALAEMGKESANELYEQQLARWDTLPPRQQGFMIQVAHTLGRHEEAANIYADIMSDIRDLPRENMQERTQNWLFWGTTHYAIAEGKFDEAFELMELAKSNPADYQLLVASLAYTTNQRYSSFRDDPRFEPHRYAIVHLVN